MNNHYNEVEKLIFSARQRVEPQLETPRSMARWDLYTHLGTLYLFSDRVDARLVERAARAAERLCSRFCGRFGALLWRMLDVQARACRFVLGYRIGDVQEQLDAAWRYIRTEAFGKEVLRVPK
ncbi:hypothetical protein ACFCP7_12590 [Paenibacillus elgii]